MSLLLFVNSRVQDLDSWKIYFRYPWKECFSKEGQFWKQQPTLSSESCNLPCSSGHKSQPFGGTFSTAPTLRPNLPVCFTLGASSLGGRSYQLGDMDLESRYDEKEGPQPHLCCPQAHRHWEEDVHRTLGPANGFTAAARSLSVKRFCPSAWTRETPKSLPST